MMAKSTDSRKPPTFRSPDAAGSYTWVDPDLEKRFSAEFLPPRVATEKSYSRTDRDEVALAVKASEAFTSASEYSPKDRRKSKSRGRKRRKARRLLLGKFRWHQAISSPFLSSEVVRWGRAVSAVFMLATLATSLATEETLIGALMGVSNWIKLTTFFFFGLGAYLGFSPRWAKRRLIRFALLALWTISSSASIFVALAYWILSSIPDSPIDNMNILISPLKIVLYLVPVLLAAFSFVTGNIPFYPSGGIIVVFAAGVFVVITISVGSATGAWEYDFLSPTDPRAAWVYPSSILGVACSAMLMLLLTYLRDTVIREGRCLAVSESVGRSSTRLGSVSADSLDAISAKRSTRIASESTRMTIAMVQNKVAPTIEQRRREASQRSMSRLDDMIIEQQPLKPLTLADVGAEFGSTIPVQKS